MNVRIINTDELNLLFQRFDYNNPDERFAVKISVLISLLSAFIRIFMANERSYSLL